MVVDQVAVVRHQEDSVDPRHQVQEGTHVLPQGQHRDNNPTNSSKAVVWAVVWAA